ncbi:MAG: hypothetical protein PHF29_00940 [Candidatus Riflebacteria bacterium]|nr:hypothetical protein [Candidatus Riflebacteria bacterium]
MKKKTHEGNFVTIDIGSVSIKAVVLEINAKTKRLVTVEEEKYAAPLLNREDEQSKVIVVKALKRIYERLSSYKNITIGALYSSRELQVKILDLPQQIQADVLEKTLNWEARKMLSASYKDAPYSYSYKIIRNNPFSVVLSVVPDSLLKKHIDLFKSAGIKLNGLYPEVYSGAALLGMADITGLPAVSVVNVGYVGTHLQIFSAGELKFYRYIPSGMSEMSAKPTAAELEVYSQKIRFSFDYFRAVSKLNQIDLLSFMGGGAASEGFLPYEQSYFSPTKINALDVSSGIDIAAVMSKAHNEAVTAEAKQNFILSFIPAIGGSLAASAGDSDKMNLIAQMTAREKERLYENFVNKMPVYAAVGIVLTALVVSFAYKGLIDEKISEQRNQIAIQKQKAIELESEGEIMKDKNGRPIQILKLSGKLGKILNPVVERPDISVALARVRILARENGITPEEILVKTEAEASFINLPASEATSNNSELKKEESETNPYLSSLEQTEMGEQELASSIDGEVCIIKGLGSDASCVAEFAKRLVDASAGKQRKKGPLLRIVSVASRQTPKGTEFLIKGVLP